MTELELTADLLADEIIEEATANGVFDEERASELVDTYAPENEAVMYSPRALIGAASGEQVEAAFGKARDCGFTQDPGSFRELSQDVARFLLEDALFAAIGAKRKAAQDNGAAS